MSSQPDVVVVGGGPGGAATAYWLARNGLSVVVVEKKAYPREKACGDALTPRAVKQLLEMGFAFDIAELHRITGLRAYAGDLTIELPWPDHTVYPNWGAVIRRTDLDMQVAMLAKRQGAIIRQQTEAKPELDGGMLTGVILEEKNGSEVIRRDVLHPKFVVIADGSLSRFGRALGASRRKDYPYGQAMRGYYRSPSSKDSFLESQLNIYDSEGRAMPGYGWVFPLGDGTINVGVGVVSSFSNWKSVNVPKVMGAHVDGLPDYWEATQDSVIGRPIGGKLPMSFSTEPKVGSNWIVVGDAAGAVNPFNGEGIDYAYETGRMAADYIAEAIATGDRAILHRYPQALDDEYGAYHRVARAFVFAIGNPALMRSLTRISIKSKPLMEWVLKVMANLLEPEDYGIAERLYHLIERVVRAGPESVTKAR